MKTISAIIAALIFCNVTYGETYGLAGPEPTATTQPVVPDLFGLESNTPSGNWVVVQEVVSPCPGGVCPLPTATRRTVSYAEQPVVEYVSTVSTVSNCPNCPNCPTASYSTVGTMKPSSTVVPPGYHAHRAFDGSIVVHPNGSSDHRGMSWTRIAESGDTITGNAVTRSATRSGTFFGRLFNRSRPVGWRFRPFLRMRMGW